MNCHTAMTATAGRAQVGFCSTTGWGLMPSHGSRPTTGSISESNTTAATATDVTTVEEKISRRRPCRGGPVGGHGQQQAAMRPAGTTMTTKRSVVTRLWWKLRRGEHLPTWWSPT